MGRTNVVHKWLKPNSSKQQHQPDVSNSTSHEQTVNIFMVAQQHYISNATFKV